MKGGDHLSKGQIFKIVLLVVTIALSAIQGITEMDGDMLPCLPTTVLKLYSATPHLEMKKDW